ncbi:MAG: murein biosynthesis integral membrane protein MurJ [Candidatus Moranbacteria bacterium RBG_19FT_COMBO_42_6]|nr:MAG: murein biosynthesis integral membrane protein MurJ [Candidatus Moranbacteria bacterium RBG_19FT_COMBO_42_6]
MIKKIFTNGILSSGPSGSVVSAAFIITVAGLASRILGLFRDRLLASTFGAGDTLDAYYAAFRIPDLIYNLLILGALSAAFIPVFTGLISHEKEDEAWDLFNGVLNLAAISIIAISLIIALFAPFIMKLITPGFSPDKMKTVVLFTRIMLLSPLFLGISGIMGGSLISFKRFLVYSIAPIMYNVGIIMGVLVFVKIWGPAGLAVGVVFGALLHMLIQYPAAKNIGFRYRWSFKEAIFNSNVKKVITLMIPRTIGIAVNQINLLIITIFASTLAAGSLAIFSFAQNLQGVPLGLFGASFSIAVFPVLAALAAKGEKGNFVKIFSVTFRQILFFIIPLSVFILVLRAQIVRVVLGAGKFDWEDTILTFQALGIFALSLFAQGTIPLLARAFYALHDTKTPFYIALFTEMVNISAVLILIGRYNVIGLAIAFSLSAVVQMLLLLFVLRSRFDNLDDKNIIKFSLKIAVASVVAGLSIQLAKYLVAPMIDLDTFVGIFIQLAASSLVGLSVFAGMCYTLKLEEFFKFKNALTRKLFKGKQTIIEDTADVSGI